LLFPRLMNGAIEALETIIREQEKAARDAQSKADDIDAACFDLKAVNPNAIVKTDDRTPAMIIENIEAQGKIVTAALERLKTLLEEHI
jgi:type I restriction enzyme M protein